jgi:glycosyltransferase involved in cell wall biosynthesis
VRILYVVHQFFPEFGSGTERVTLNLARMAQRAGHGVQVLACMLDRGRHPDAEPGPWPGSWRSVVEGVPVTWIERADLPDSAEQGFELAEPVVTHVEAWLRAQRFELVHLMHGMRMASAVAAVQRCGLPLVATLTDFYPACLRINLIDQRDRPCDGPAQGSACAAKCVTPAWPATRLAQRHVHGHALLAAAAVRVAPSRFVAERYRAAFPDLPVEVVAHGVDLLALARGRPASMPARPLTLAFVGSLIEAKGLHVLLQALATLPGLPLRLQVAGAFHGPEAYRRRIEALLASDARVQWLGPRSASEVAALLHETDLLCLPSLVAESFSLVLHEAAALGVPALVSDLGAPPQALAAGGGQAVPPGEVRAWALALERWAGDPALRTAWQRGVPLPQRIEEEAFLYEALYRAAMGRTGSAPKPV